MWWTSGAGDRTERKDAEAVIPLSIGSVGVWKQPYHGSRIGTIPWFLVWMVLGCSEQPRLASCSETSRYSTSTTVSQVPTPDTQMHRQLRPILPSNVPIRSLGSQHPSS